MKIDSEWRRYLQYSTIGIEMGASVAVGGLIGYWLDFYFGTDPWQLLFWSLCGIFAGFRSLYRLTKKVLKEGQINETKGSD